MIDSIEEIKDKIVIRGVPYIRKTRIDFGEDAVIIGEKNKLSALEEALKNNSEVDLSNLRIMRVMDTDDEETQIQKMNLISLALDNPNEQVVPTLNNQNKLVAETAVEYIPEFGSKNPELAENPKLERQKMELLKKALDNKYGLVRSEAVARLYHQFFSSDSELVMSCKDEVLKYGLRSLKKDVREGIISDIKYREDDNERITLLKDMLVRIALESENVEVREIAKTKKKRDYRTAMDFLKENK